MNRFVLAVMLIAAAVPAGPWQRFGPKGITLAALARVPGSINEVYAVTEGMPALVFHSGDGGGSWSLRDTIYDRVAELVTVPGQPTLFAGGATGRIWRSLDGGWFWNEVGALPGSPGLRRLALRHGTEQVLLAAIEIAVSDTMVALGLHVSTDGGGSWSGTRVDSGRTVRAAALDLDPQRPARVLLGGDVDGRARLYLSADGGAGWNEITGELTGDCLWAAAASPLDPAVLLAATDDGIWRTSNGGAGWSRMKDVPAWSVAFGAAAPHYAYAGSDNLVFRSNNLGINWFADTTAFAGTFTRRLEINPLDGLDLYAVNGRGFFRTTDGGFSWQERTRGLDRLTIPYLDFHPLSGDSVFACPPGYGILVSGNRGLSWDSIPGFPGAGFTSATLVSPAAPDTFYAVTGNSHWLYMTSDRGDSWVRQRVETGFSGEGLAVHPTGPDTFYAWGGVRPFESEERFGFWKSTDRGHNWARIFSPGARGRCHGYRTTGGSDSLFLWGTVDDRPRVYLSLDRGGNWQSRSSGLTGTAVTDFKTAPGDNRTSYVCATDAGVFRTLDGGVSWTRLGLRNVSAVLPDTADPNLLFAATDTQGLFRTTNSGAIWERDTVALPVRSIAFLRRHPDDKAVVYCGTVGQGLYGLGVIGVSEPGRPGRRGSLVVAPTVVRSGAWVEPGTAGQPAVVELFSADGRRAGPKTTLDPAPGRWFWARPRELPAGVYLMRVRAAGLERTARLVLTD